MGRLNWLLLLPALSTYANIDSTLLVKRTSDGGIHLPIVRRINQPSPAALARRGTQTGSIGLGNFLDVTYQVMVKVGSVETPLILDTGSSDLWVISDQCTGNCTDGKVPTYPQASFQSEGLGVDLRYGDSQTGTFADGLIGRDTAAVAGLSVDKQIFAAINSTNTSVADSGAAGIFGLGFPINSVLFSAIFAKEFPQDVKGGSGSPTQSLPSEETPAAMHRRRSPAVEILRAELAKRQTGGSDPVGDLLSTIPTNSPLLTRLVAQGALAQPMVAITLSRNTIDIGGNEGLLSIGALPAGVSNDSLTWVPVRLYTQDQGGLPAPQSSPGERFPVTWEIPIDDVYMNGELVPQTRLAGAAEGLGVTALVDTGNSLMRGPQDLVNAILASLSSRGDGTFPCDEPQTMEFVIGGKRFPIDPRDFLTQVEQGNTRTCGANLVPTDPPAVGGLFTWSIGDPFLKSALVAFYYGNLTHPSVDPPRIGFLSTVPSDANAKLSAAVAAATGGQFAATENAAPTGVPAPAGTGSAGVPQAGSGGSGSGSGGTKPGAASARTGYPAGITAMAASIVVIAIGLVTM